MKKIAKIALLAVSSALMVQAAKAQSDSGNPNNDDLVLGFTSQSVTSDYILDLGPLPGTGNTQIGGISLSTFTTIFGSALSAGSVNVGIVGGGPNDASDDIFTTTLDNGTGTALVAGSTAPKYTTDNFIANASQLPLSLNLGQTAQSSSASWSTLIAQGPGLTGTAPLGHSFSGYLPTSDNPMVSLPSGGVVTLDLWNNVQTGGKDSWSYVGNVLVDVSGSTLNAVYDPAPAPEPTTLSLLAGAGGLGLAFRRQFSRKNS